MLAIMTTRGDTMNRFMSACTMVLLAAFLGLNVAGCSQSEPIRIGAILILTDQNGDRLSVETETLNGMELAIKEINEAGGIHGTKVELIYRDCQGRPELAKKQFRELAALSPAAVINIYTHITEALVPLATELKTIQLATLATGENITQNAPYSFRYWPQSSDEGRAILPLVDKLRVRKLGLVNIDNTYGNSVSDELSSLLIGKNVATKRIVYSEIDSSLTKKLESLADCDAISFTCFPINMVPLATVIRERYPDKILIGPNSISSPHHIKHPIFDGVYIAAPLIYNPASPYLGDVGPRLEKTYGLPLSHYSAIGYDVITLLAQIVAKAGTSPEAVRKTFKTGFVFPGLFGDVVNAQGSHHMAYQLIPAVIKDQRLKYQRR